jgi:hypothetical protein
VRNAHFAHADFKELVDHRVLSVAAQTIADVAQLYDVPVMRAEVLRGTSTPITSRQDRMQDTFEPLPGGVDAPVQALNQPLSSLAPARTRALLTCGVEQ